MRRKVKKTFFLLTFAVLFLALIAFTFPLEILEAKTLLGHRMRGAHVVDLSGIKALEYDSCASDKKNCHCLALLHGFSDNLYTWTKITKLHAPRWKTHHRVEILNLPGSQSFFLRPTAEISKLDELSKTILSSLAERCPKWTLIGNSAGGWLAALMASQRPGLISKIILIDPAGFEVSRDEMQRAAALLSDPTARSLKEFQRMAEPHPHKISDFFWKKVAQSVSQEVRMFKKIIADNQSPELFVDAFGPRIQSDVILLWGAEDHVFKVSDAEAWKNELRSRIIESHVVPDCGHLPQRECPEKIEKFLID